MPRYPLEDEAKEGQILDADADINNTLIYTHNISR